jgi:hypothetical protein
LIVGDVVDLEGTGVDVSQHQIGFTGSVTRADARELPIHFQPAGRTVAQQQVGLAGDAGSMTDATKIGAATAKGGNDALRRLSREVQHRPLVTLAVAVGVGI